MKTNDELLIKVRDELYSGSWRKMLKDLNSRLTGKPKIFRLNKKIEADIAAIKKLMKKGK